MSNNLTKKMEIAEEMKAKEMAKEMEARCVPAARDIFRLFGEWADKFPMGDDIKPDDLQEVMPAFVREVGEIIKKYGLNRRDVRRVTMYMNTPLEDYQWRLDAFLDSIRDAVMQKALGKPYDTILLSDMMLFADIDETNKKEDNPQPALEENKEVE